MEKEFLTYKGAVQTWECDSNGHMNVMYYINKFELGGRNCSVEFGMTKKFLESNNFGIAVVEQIIQYKREVFEDDLLYIMSSVKGVANKVFHFEHKLYNKSEGVLSATMNAKLVIFDLKLRRAIEIPDEFRQNLTKLL